MSKPATSTQWSVYTAYLAFCLGIFMLVVNHGFAFVPGSHLHECFNYMNKFLCINNKLSYVYMIFDKIGSTANGFNRLVYYAKQYKDFSSQLVELALPIISIDTLPATLQLDLTDAMLNGIKAFVLFKTFPTTIREAVRCEMTGIPFATQVFFFAMFKNSSECLVIGGAIYLFGTLRRLYLSILESGAQVSPYGYYCVCTPPSNRRRPG